LPGRKGNTEKGKGRGQTSEKIRSPLHLAQNVSNFGRLFTDFLLILTKFFREFPKMQQFKQFSSLAEWLQISENLNFAHI